MFQMLSSAPKAHHESCYYKDYKVYKYKILHSINGADEEITSFKDCVARKKEPDLVNVLYL